MALIDKMEEQLRPPEEFVDLEYPAKYITLATGEKMVIRQISREECPVALEAIKPLMDVEKDFYDIVAVRMYAEILAYMRYRVKDEYIFLGTINGEIVGIVNGRSVDAKTGMSYHTIAIRQGLRLGDIGGQVQPGPALAVDLHQDFDRRLHALRLVPGGPGLVRDALSEALALPDFLRDVRREGAQQQQENLIFALRDLSGIGDDIQQAHQRRDVRVVF